jgi:hypothetical protein
MSESMMASLPAATGTRLDSGCKHIQQCRVSQDHMARLADDGQEGLLRHKLQFAVHKDELVLGVAAPWSENGVVNANNAYPRVVSNLGDITKDKWEAKLLKYVYHNTTSLAMRSSLLDAINTGVVTRWVRPGAGRNAFFTPRTPGGPVMAFMDDMKKIFDCFPVGYANTLGYAHRETGDTMTSVMIGGLRTVVNGDFEMKAGDLVQWYWPFERDCFTSTGTRKPVSLAVAGAGGLANFPNEDPAENGAVVGGAFPCGAALERQRFFERQYGNPKNGKHVKLVPFVKAYKQDDEQPRLYDSYRVFGYALCDARAHESVDIKIQRQSL